MVTQNDNQSQNKYAYSALWLGIASVFFGMIFIPPILAIFYGSKGIARSTELKNEGVEKTGRAKSIAGLVLGLLYLVAGFYQWAR